MRSINMGVDLIPSDIKSARKQLGLSINGMAAALGMNRRTIIRMEKGEWLITKRTAAQVENLLRLNREK